MNQHLVPKSRIEYETGEELGKAQHEYVAAAQNKSKNAFRASLAAAYTYFTSQLETDQSVLDALQLRLPW